jgi:hypothetical protein
MSSDCPPGNLGDIFLLAPRLVAIRLSGRGSQLWVSELTNIRDGDVLAVLKIAYHEGILKLAHEEGQQV